MLTQVLLGYLSLLLHLVTFFFFFLSDFSQELIVHAGHLYCLSAYGDDFFFFFEFGEVILENQPLLGVLLHYSFFYHLPPIRFFQTCPWRGQTLLSWSPVLWSSFSLFSLLSGSWMYHSMVTRPKATHSLQILCFQVWGQVEHLPLSNSVSLLENGP